MKPTDKNRVTEDEIIRAIRQVNEDAEIVEAFKSVSEHDLRAILQRERNRKPKAKRVQMWLYAVSSAAAILLLLFVLDVFRTDDTNQQLFAEGTHLFAETFRMPQGDYTFRGDTMGNFFDLYNKGLFGEALASISTIPKEDLHPLLKFYASVILMKIGDMPKAIELLSELHAARPHQANIRWYLALAYLHENQIDKTKELLRGIDDGEYLERARELLRRLR
jgi:tetratricopeptide (TPR) repeat protein